MTKECTVLVVEDEALIRMDLICRLEERGFLTVDADSADAAIAILERRSDITVVFTDVQMPGSMDGLQLARYVHKRWPPTIIVVTSGRVIPDDGLLEDGVPFLAKPYDDFALGRVLSDVRQRLETTPPL
jgi:CheY-like chemotaxis protein